MTKKLDLLPVTGKIPIEIKKGSILNIITNDVTPITHGFHKYPAKFIPQIPKWAISKYLNHKTNCTILDPFCGSGTTLIEGLTNGHNVIGFDIDPLSALISKVKTTRINILKLREVSDWILININSDIHVDFSPECETIEHWFTKDAIYKLSKIRTLINQVPNNFGEGKDIVNIQDLLIICFSSIIRRVSNADNESQKTYVSHTLIKEPEEVNDLFSFKLKYFIERIEKFNNNSSEDHKSNIIVSSCAYNLTEKLNGQEIDLAITSPPYIKAVDYIYNQMVELFWIGDRFGMQTQTKQNNNKKNYIGNKQIPKSEYKDYSPILNKTNIKNLDKNLIEIFENDKKNGHKHSYITYKYFCEMELHFKEISSVLKKDAHYILVVGDSNVSNVYINTSDFLSIIAERNNLKLCNKWGYKIKNRFMRFDRKGRGGFIDIDWVLDFQKTQ